MKFLGSRSTTFGRQFTRFPTCCVAGRVIDSESELLSYLDEYDSKWPSLQLRAIYQQAFDDAAG